MHIGIDYTSAVRQRGGIGRYTRELVAALAELPPTNCYTLLVQDRGMIGRLPRLPGHFAIRTTPLSEPTLTRLWHRLHLPLPVEWFTGPVDIFHAPDFVLPPTRPGTRTLLTVHDLTFIRDPDSAPARLRAYLNAVVPRSVRRADRVLADSRATRDDLIAEYHLPPDKVAVVYAGVGPEFRPVTDPARLAAVCARYRIRPPFVFSVGTIQPRKNYVRLIQAFAQLPRSDLCLVIAGGKGWLFDEIYRAAQTLGIEERVLFPGFVADEDLPALYSAAAVVAYVSLYEGFGLPITEAMACGAPVVVSNASSLPEVAGEAGLLVDPTDVTSIAEGLRRALDDADLRAELCRRGPIQATRFTWTAAAECIEQMYCSLSDE